MDEKTNVAPRNSPVPLKFTRESFYGFDMTDEDIGSGEYRSLAIEVKHLFESIAADADEKNEEVFFTKELDHALRRFLIDPSKASLEYLLEVCPTLAQHSGELNELLRMLQDPEGNP